MKNNQGGNMLIEMIILGLICATLLTVLWVKHYTEKPSQLSNENAASIKDMSTHLSEIDEKVKDCHQVTADLSNLRTQVGTLATQVSDVLEEIEDAQEHTSLVSKNDNRIALELSALKSRVDSIPREMSFKLQGIKEAIPMEIKNTTFISKSWIDREKKSITDRNGKRVEKLVPVRKQYMKPVNRVRKSKFKMPGVEEAKSKFVEASL